MEDANEKFERALDRIAPREHMSSKGEIVEYYQKRYGEKKWTQAIAKDLYGSIKNRKGENASVKSIQRRFQGERLKREEGKSAEIYKQLGKKLPPTNRRMIPPKFTVKVKGKFNPSPKRRGKGESAREREIEIEFSGADALDFASNPDPEIFFEMYGVDGQTFVDMMDDSATVTAY